MTTEAQRRWTELMGAGGAQDRHGDEVMPADLPAPGGLTAVGGRGQVTLDWQPVPGAIGYAVHRAVAPGGPFELVDHGGGDVLAVPHGPYADSTGEPGTRYWYAVAPLETVNAMGPLSAPVAAESTVDGSAQVAIDVDANGDAGPFHRPWQAMVGSEHLSHLLCSDGPAGKTIGVELAEALRRVHDELGVASVRAHAILGDDLGVYREVDGEPRLDFTGVDRVYDIVLGLGLRPVVELSFMPRDLAADPSRTVFFYQAVISPPKDWDRWAWLVSSFTSHLIERYGRDEVLRWPFEVWNEANLSVFWSGTPAEYWRLYKVAADAVKAVDPDIQVGGPASAAVGWIAEQLAVDAPVDFVSTHTYGSPPLDLRPLVGDRPLLWTEWGVTASHGSQVNDTVFAAAFLLRGMHSAAAREVAALAPWVASDHFEELGRPSRLLHGGFGLLTVGNLAKPKYWALWLASQLGPRLLPVTLHGDGAGSLVECWATGGSSVRVLLWNGTLDHGKASGSALLSRRVSLDVSGVTGDSALVRHWRVDESHSNLLALWDGSRDWPDEGEWRSLAAADRVEELSPPEHVPVRDGSVTLSFDLPMPSISYIEVSPGSGGEPGHARPADPRRP
jgi:xylan 1,4-beta-xylosidase